MRKYGSILFNAIYRWMSFWIYLGISCIVVSALLIIPLFLYFSKDLPDYQELLKYDPPTISRIYTSEGDLMAELAKERRVFRPFIEIPELVINAFIAAEDQNYYNHPGIDITSIMRAVWQNITNFGKDKNLVGGSTITQQVVKNFLLTNERSISRKIKEAILAYRINKVYSKSRILELYLNQIYLGNGAYGVTSAALAYFNKDLSSITLEEAAMLAALPKAPSSLDPSKNISRVKPRRDWVIDRMFEEGFISKQQAMEAKGKQIKLDSRFNVSVIDNGYYTESTRLALIDMYGHDSVYQDGFSVYTNINIHLQKLADQALRKGLLSYDKRHGYKGPISKIEVADWKNKIKQVEVPAAIGSWQLAVVLGVSAESASIGIRDGSTASILLEDLSWARTRLKNGYVGKSISAPKDVFNVGDVILVSKDEDGLWHLQQIPEANGAIVVMEVKSGKVLAMSGGYSFKESKYNRAIQALRQPGSSFKPFVYLTALEKGFKPTTIIMDEAISISQGPGMPAWEPKNYEGKFLGAITMRKAFEKSRNLATVYLITKVGARSVGEMATRLGVYDKTPAAYYSMALGANETTLMKLTAAYASIASGGIKVTPKLIDLIEDRKGNVIYKSERGVCKGCDFHSQEPAISYALEHLIEPRSNYQMISMLQGAVERGTAVRAKSIGKTVAGKTGTSNEVMDTWFIGFSPDIVVGVFVGHDSPKTLGEKEQGASVALPIFIDFMTNALAKVPDKSFEVPEGLEIMRADYDTGKSKLIDIGKRGVDEPVKYGETLEDEINSETGRDFHITGDENSGDGIDGIY